MVSALTSCCCYRDATGRFEQKNPEPFTQHARSLPTTVKNWPSINIQASNRAQLIKSSYVHQVQDWSIWTLPTSDKQYDNGTSVAGVPLAQHPEDIVFATTRDIGEKIVWESDGSATHNEKKKLKVPRNPNACWLLLIRSDVYTTYCLTLGYKCVSYIL